MAAEGAGDLALVVDGRGVVPDPDDGQVRDDPDVAGQRRRGGLDLGPDLGRERAAVEDAGGQRDGS